MPHRVPAALRPLVAGLAGATLSLSAPRLARAQTRPGPIADPAAAATDPRPIPGPAYETLPFSRAVARGTRTRTGVPGPGYWVQHPRYVISAALDPVRGEVTGRESVVYVNRSPDTLTRIAVYLRQNVFAPGVPRRDVVPITGGVRLGSVVLDARALRPVADTPAPGEYAVDGTVMWIATLHPLTPGDSLRLEVAWRYTPAPTPSDGREGRDGRVFFMGYWYPQIAVYDDVDGWVTDPYQLEAEFYMDPADYDVRLTVPHGWVVGATGTLQNPDAVLSAAARDSLAEARATGRVVRIVTPGPGARRAFASGGPRATWHYLAPGVRDFAWGTSDQYAWDATRALVGGGAGAAPDTVTIASFFRLRAPAAAWRLGGARFTRDAIEQMSAWLWPYPWPAMTSMEGVLTSGGMEYPMMTLMQSWADTLSLAGDLMHETGHMWFPMQVGSNETRSPWMDEGFTQFDVAQAMRALYGAPRSGGRPNDSEAGQRAAYLAAVRAGRDGPLMWPGGDDYPPALYFNVFYNKTAQVLAALRAVLGPDTFHRGLVEYGRRWIGRHPQPYDFFNTMSDVAGRDLSWFWSTWFYRAWPLDQAIESVTPAGDSVQITVADRGLAPMPVPLVITRADGTVQRLELPVQVWLGGARRTSVSVAAQPVVVRVAIDPDGLYPDVDRSNQTWPATGTPP